MATNTVGEQYSEYRWLSTDRGSVEWAAAQVTAPPGILGRELDTGRTYYMALDRDEWVEYEGRDAYHTRLLLEEVKRMAKDHLRILEQLRDAVDELAS